jgi:hypothetical protein
MKFKVYGDFTTDQPIVPFYFGKGDASRVAEIERNLHHSNVAAKHGINRVVVYETDDEVKALEREIELIAEHHTYVYDPFYNGIGTNYTKGGEGISGYRHTEETIKQIRRKCSGRKHTPEEIAKQVTAQTGRVMTVEDRSSRSQNRKDKKPVVQLSITGEEIARHESLKTAAKAIGGKAHPAAISMCCRGMLQTSYGYVWRFV